MSLLQPFARLVCASSRNLGRLVKSQGYSTSVVRRPSRLSQPLLWGGAVAVAASLGFTASTVYADADQKSTAKPEEIEDNVGES